MFCIKCGENSQSNGMLCKKCEKKSGFGVSSREAFEKKKTSGFYLALIGNLCIIISLLCSFVLVKNEAPVDYVAEIFEEKALAPVETEDAQDEDESDGEEDTVVMEETGYAYSVFAYITKRSVTDEKDIETLQTVADHIDSSDLESLNLSDEESLARLQTWYGSSYDDVLTTLKYYHGKRAQGIVVFVIAVLALGTAVWLLFRRDFRWSILFSFLGTVPVYLLCYQLNGLVEWEYQKGIYVFLIGMFAVLAGNLMGGNIDTCPNCHKELPGGAGFCYGCGEDLRWDKKKESRVGMWIEKNSIPMEIAGNILFFVGLILPIFKIHNSQKVQAISLFGLRGMQEASDKGKSGLLLFLLVMGLLFLIGAVVAAIFEYSLLSTGAGLAAMAMVCLLVYFAQKIAVISVSALFFVLPVGFFLSVYAGTVNVKNGRGHQ